MKISVLWKTLSVIICLWWSATSQIKMPRTGELSIEKRSAIVAEFKCGVCVSDLAKKYGVHRNTIRYQVIKEKYKGNVQNIKGRGRKRKTTKREDAEIVRIVKGNPRTTVKSILKDFNENRDNKVCRTTISNRLKEANIKAYTVQKKPYISGKNKRVRLKFAREHIHKPPEFWRNILWTDECAFSLDGTYGKDFFYSSIREKKNRAVYTHTRHTDGGKVLIWGCMAYNGVGPVIKLPKKVCASHYLGILNDVALVAGCKLINSGFVLQQDNAPIHTAWIIKKYLSVVDQNIIDWPPQSPDLNVIENLWHYMKGKIPQQIGRSEVETWELIQNTWEAIPTQLLQNLIDSMPRRLQEVIDASGGNTSY